MNTSLLLFAAGLALASADLVCTGPTNAHSDWCDQACNHVPSFCPAFLCSCVEAVPEPVVPGAGGCSVQPAFSNTPIRTATHTVWCFDNCFHEPPYCPSQICDCSDSIPFENAFIAAFFVEKSQNLAPEDVDTDTRGACTSWFTPTRSNIIVRCRTDATDLVSFEVQMGVLGQGGPVIHTGDPTTLNMFDPAGGTNELHQWLAGNLYVNLKSTSNPNGELRGQIARVQNGATYYNFFATADQVAGAFTPHPEGSATCASVLRENPFDATEFDFVVVCLHNIDSSTITSAIVGGGPEGVFGAEILTLDVSPGPFVEGQFVLNDQQNTNTLNGLWFVQINTDSGSIRGQIVDSAVLSYPVV